MASTFRLFFSRAAPWLAAAALWLLFELPTLIGADGFSPLELRPTGELLVLATAAYLAARAGLDRHAVAAAGVLAAVLLVLRVDFSLYNVVMRAQPLLYDQLHTIRHFLLLLADLFTLGKLLDWLGVLAICGVAAWVIRFLVRRLTPLATDRARPAGQVLAALWILVLPATLFGPGRESLPWVRWMVPELADNVRRSLALHRAVQRGLKESPYRGFQQVRLEQKPDVLVFFVESYGRVLAEDPHTATRWRTTLQELEARLSRGGWCAASGFSTAPVSGGWSWLAVGSIFFGADIRYEGVFQRLVDEGPRLPSLPRFFDGQGYTTVNVAPSVRVRPGLELENRYGYQKYLRRPDFGYRGPDMGWGIIPDQYALGVAEETVLSRVEGPLFLHFHMVSSHFPWERVPDYVTDFRDWNTRGEELQQRAAAAESRASALGFTEKYRDGYERSVYYDFRIIEDFLSRRDRNALVVVMGDHQPFLLTSRKDSFDVPVHLLARDPALLDEFVERGFSRGIVPTTFQPAAVKHEGLFSLLVRALARAQGTGALPDYVPGGVRVDG